MLTSLETNSYSSSCPDGDSQRRLQQNPREKTAGRWQGVQPETTRTRDPSQRQFLLTFIFVRAKKRDVAWISKS